MKKILCIMVAFAALAISARADTHTYTTTLTNGQLITYSDALPVSGWLDKIEVTAEAASTTTVTIATFAGTTAIETFASKVINGATPVVFRPRFQPTDIGATNLAAVVDQTVTNAATAVSRVLAIPFEKAMIGGNTKVALTGTANDNSCPITITIFYNPLPK